MSNTKKDFPKRSSNIRQFPSSKPASFSRSSESQPFPLPILPRPDIPEGRLAHFVEQWGEFTQNKWALSIVQESFRIPFNLTPPLSTVSINLSQSSSLWLQEEIMELLQKCAVQRIQDPGTPGFYSQLFLVQKKKKKTNGKLHSVIGLSLLNLHVYIKKQPFKMETVKSEWQSILVNNWAVSIDLTDAYLHVPIHSQSRKYLCFVFNNQAFQFMALMLGMSLSPWIFWISPKGWMYGWGDHLELMRLSFHGRWTEE